jgi:hypothetical protein
MTLVRSLHTGTSLENKRYGNRALGPDTASLKLLLPFIITLVSTRVSNPHHFNADPGQLLHFYADPDPDPAFSLYTDPDLLLIKVMQTCDNWPTDPPGLHFEPPRLHLGVHGPPRLRIESRKRLNFDCNAYPDPPFHSSADADLDPDPTSTNNADPDPKAWYRYQLSQCGQFILFSELHCWLLMRVSYLYPIVVELRNIFCEFYLRPGITRMLIFVNFSFLF